jgi:hypothetical protein
MDGDDRVLAIVLAAEHLLRFAGFDLGTELVEAACQIVEDGLPRLRPFDENRQIVDAALQRIAQPGIVLQPAPPLQQLLRRGLIFPEVRFGDALFYARELVRGAGGVKDSSADRMRAWRDPDTGGAARRVEWRPLIPFILTCGGWRPVRQS